MVEERLAEASARVQAELGRLLPGVTGTAALDQLAEAMKYACEGGKGIRGALVLETCALCDVPEEAALSAAAGIEAMHAYSLVHDDLPAMDDDDLRRGRPTVHKAYSEWKAILVGDALQALAFDAVSRLEPVPADRVLELTRLLSHAAGAPGMVAGQWLDLDAERSVDPPTDRQEHTALIQSLKTGALLRWSCEAGPILGGKDRAPFRTYADAIGLAFQIQDDLLDVEGDAKVVGKAVGKDAGRGKATFVDLLGVDGARAKARTLAEDAVRALEPYGEPAAFLRQLARFIVTRAS